MIPTAMLWVSPRASRPRWRPDSYSAFADIGPHLFACGVEAFMPPPRICRLHVFADNDQKFAGQAAGYNLARRLSRAGLKVDVHLPFRLGADWLDVLNERSGR